MRLQPPSGLARGLRRLLVPCATAICMLIVLISLGTWQVHRLHWKEGILAQIAAAEASPAIQLVRNPAPYAKVSATGHFRFDQAAQYGAEVRDTRTGSAMGSYQVVPLERSGSATILVDRGWVPEKRLTALDDPAGEVTVTGYVRPSETAHWFSPADDAAARRFYTLDPPVIAAAIGVSDVAPFILVALGDNTPNTYPAPAIHLPRPPNNHLSYVITWYGLAASLVVIFVLWIRKALRP